MFKRGSVGFGDKVRIEESADTIASGHAGRVGDCYGMTTPSATGVDVIGGASDDDVALNVHFDAPEVEDAWFSPDLVVLVEHPEGSKAVVGDQAFVMDSEGAWHPDSSAKSEQARRRFWRRR